MQCLKLVLKIDLKFSILLQIATEREKLKKLFLKWIIIESWGFLLVTWSNDSLSLFNEFLDILSVSWGLQFFMKGAFKLDFLILLEDVGSNEVYVSPEFIQYNIHGRSRGIKLHDKICSFPKNVCQTSLQDITK
jgi:hypothetical protein